MSDNQSLENLASDGWRKACMKSWKIRIVTGVLCEVSAGALAFGAEHSERFKDGMLGGAFGLALSGFLYLGSAYLWRRRAETGSYFHIGKD